MDQLEGRVAVVTGAADGIGLALCRRFAAAGARVVMADIDEEKLAISTAGLEADGAVVLAVPTDVSDPERVKELERRTVERFGAAHVLCNNAGVGGAVAPVWKLDPEAFDWMLGINLKGVLHGVQAFVPGMIERGEPGHVVNTASIGGLLGFPHIGAYCTSKFAVVGLSESLLLDLRARKLPIGVSVLCPGATATRLTENTQRLRGEEEASMEDPPGSVRADPLEIAGQVLEAILAERFFVVTHPGYAAPLRERHGVIEAGDGEPSPAGFYL